MIDLKPDNKANCNQKRCNQRSNIDFANALLKKT